MRAGGPTKQRGIEMLITGLRVRKRGFKHEGKIVKADKTWATIEWDDGPMPIERPTMCHIKELEFADAWDEYYLGQEERAGQPRFLNSIPETRD